MKVYTCKNVLERIKTKDTPHFWRWIYNSNHGCLITFFFILSFIHGRSMSDFYGRHNGPGVLLLMAAFQGRLLLLIDTDSSHDCRAKLSRQNVPMSNRLHHTNAISHHILAIIGNHPKLSLTTPQTSLCSGTIYKVEGQLGLKSSWPLSQRGPGSIRPESTRPGVFSEHIWYMFCFLYMHNHSD